MKTPELLAPAGTLKNLHYAISYGADAVYAGWPRYSLRVRNNDFRLDTLEQGIHFTHQQAKHFYLTCNLLAHNAKLKTFLADLEPIIHLQPDALIMADPGLILLVRERWPEIAIHLSVQANTLNSAAVRFWQQLGIKRIILSRELSLDEITEIRQQCPEIELEVFVHGALCIAYSGRCLLSGYFNHRDANQGACTNACRWDYPLVDTEAEEPHPAAAQTWLLKEQQQPDRLLPIQEDEHGTYILNSKDLRAVEHVERLATMGIDSLKIEGRTKSHYYVARATQVYRQAIDDAVSQRSFRPELLAELESLANRGYTDGFLQRHPPQSLQNYRENSSQSRQQRFVAEILTQTEPDWFLVNSKNQFSVGDQLELLTPKGNHRFQLQAIKNAAGHPMAKVSGGDQQIQVMLPMQADQYSLLTRIL